MKILDLVVKHKWYDMEESGEKPEEYREIKPYWFKRLIQYDREMYVGGDPIPAYFCDRAPFDTPAGNIKWDLDMSGALEFKKFTHVRFRRGYTNTTMLIKCEGITIGKGEPAWGAPEEEVFIIKLGEKV